MRPSATFAPPLFRVGLKKLLGWPILAVGAFVVGAAIVADATTGLLVALAIFGIAFVAFDAPRAERWGTLALVGGSLILGYSFSNMGIPSAFIPVPLAELLLLPLAAVALLDSRYRPPARLLLPLALFLGIITMRLLIDFPTYRTDAVRDATTAVEALALVVGYRVVKRDGVQPWIRRLAWIYLGVLVYMSFYPVRDSLRAFSPIIGLRRDVYLLGGYIGVQAAVASAALFFGVHARGVRRIVLVAWGLVLTALLQFRGSYVLLPISAGVLGWAMRRPLKVILGTFVSIALVGVALSFLAGAGVEGRRGPLTTDFYAQHIGTLFGEQGPSAGTVQAREEWISRTIDLVRESPVYLLFGVGLGPDLAFGFEEPTPQGRVLVRKPHDDFLEVFARTGLVGFVLFLWLLLTPLRAIVRGARADQGPTGRFCAWILAALVIFLGIAATQPLLAFPHGAVPTFFLLGMGAAAAESIARSQRSARVPVASAAPYAETRHGAREGNRLDAGA